MAQSPACSGTPREADALASTAPPVPLVQGASQIPLMHCVPNALPTQSFEVLQPHVRFSRQTDPYPDVDMPFAAQSAFSTHTTQSAVEGSQTDDQPSWH